MVNFNLIKDPLKIVKNIFKFEFYLKNYFYIRI